MCLLFFCQMFIFHQIKAFEKLKNVFCFILKALFFLEIFKYLYLCLLSFFHVSHCLWGWSKKNVWRHKIYYINCLNKNLITHFVWYLEKEMKCDMETLLIDRESFIVFKGLSFGDHFMFRAIIFRAIKCQLNIVVYLLGLQIVFFSTTALSKLPEWWNYTFTSIFSFILKNLVYKGIFFNKLTLVFWE